MSYMTCALDINAMPPSFTVTCWNARGLLACTSNIVLYLYHHRPAILIIIEPLIHQQSHSKFPSFNNYTVVIVKHPFQHQHGGFVLYIHNSITYQKHTTSIPTFHHTTSSSVALFHISSPMIPRPFLLIPVYMSCNASINDWKLFTRFLSHSPRTFASAHDMPVLVMGDMNVHDPLWDPAYPPPYSDPTGKHLGDFLSQDDDWHLLNLMMPSLVPTRISSHPNQRDTVIDLGISNDYNLVQMFDVNDHDMLLSDHVPIHAHLYMTSATSSPTTTVTPQRLIWRTSRSDIPWDVFQSLLADLLAPWREKWTPHLSHLITVTQHDIDTCWNELRNIITHAAMSVVGKKTVSIHHKHWFTIDPNIPSLHHQYVVLKRQLRTYKKHDRPIPHHINRQYQHARYLFRKAMRDAKQACWHELVEQVSHDHRIVWTAWHRTIPSSSSSLPAFNTSPSDPPSLTPKDNLNIMARHIKNISTLPDDPAFNKSEDNNVQQTISSLSLPSIPVTLPFTQEQLEEACQHVNTSTALGPDDISPHFLKHGGPALMSCLFLIFHLCYQHGVLPSQWKEGIVVALYKHSGDKHDVNNYRPINVTSVVMRLFDRLMLPTLLQYMSSHSIPYAFQFGFTKLRSTYDAILRLLSFIGRYFHHPIPAVFIDISKAYDRVWVHGLIHKLHTQLHMAPHDLFFYRALLTNRCFRVAGNGYMSDLFTTPDGVPQGGVSAPQLFTIYIHDLVAAIDSIYIKINLFADDIVIWASEMLNGQSVIMILIHMQQALNNMSTWASTWKITFSSTKTQLVIFYVNATLPLAYNIFKLCLSGFIITPTDTYKYLGIILHKQLDWKQHVHDLIQRVSPTSYHIARLASYHIHHRPSFNVIRQLVTTVLIPKITYALPFIQFPYPLTHSVMRRMKRLIIYPLRRALGLPNNAHHDSIFIESRVLPLQYLQIYHSILLARRYIKLAPTHVEATQRHHDIFSPASHLLLSSASDPMRYIATRCQFISHPITSTCDSLLSASSKQIWNIVFSHFYRTWYSLQHPSNPSADPHSLFPCYMNMPTCSNSTLPLYLTVLSPDMSSTVSRLRFNRSRLNQSLLKRACVHSGECSTCKNNITETVEHVLMHCSRYDQQRFALFCHLSSLLKCPPLTSSFPFPFLLCEFPASVPKSMHVVLVHRIAVFLNQVRRIRDM